MLAAAHTFWPTLFHWPHVLDLVSWWWLSVKGYALTSSIGLGWTAVLLTAWWHTRCDTPRCFRHGRYKTADGHHRQCRACHPDIPDHKLSRAEIHERHQAAKQ